MFSSSLIPSLSSFFLLRSLKHNGITNNCEQELIQLIENTLSLKYLCLDDNEFTSTSKAHIYGMWNKYHDDEEEEVEED